MSAPLARERRHTLYFLDSIRGFSPVHLDTEVDLTLVRRHRAVSESRCSTTAYLLYTAARVMAAHPAANAASDGRRSAMHDAAHGKVTLDKTMNGRRVVLSTVLYDLDRTPLEDIQERLEHFRDGDPDTMPEFGPVRLLHRLPGPLGRLLFGLAVGPLARRWRTMGTFAVTSLGHRPVDGFHSVGGTTVTLGLGRTLDRPVVRDGQVVVAPVARLNLTFDHRVIDGAEAADVLTEIKESLETFGRPVAGAKGEDGR